VFKHLLCFLMLAANNRNPSSQFGDYENAPRIRPDTHSRTTTKPEGPGLQQARAMIDGLAE
jgi:hypothetical protein